LKQQHQQKQQLESFKTNKDQEQFRKSQHQSKRSKLKDKQKKKQ